MQRGENNRRYSEDFWGIIIERYKNGESASSLARELKVSKQTVLYHIKSSDATLRDVKEICSKDLRSRHLPNGLKFCPHCNTAKPWEAFGIDRSRSDGKNNLCKPCITQRQQLYKLSWTPERKQRERDSKRRWLKSPNGKQRQKMYSATSTRSPKGRFRSAKASARKRELHWEIPFEDFCNLIKHPCHYCGGSLPETCSGLDRIDNSLGYSTANVVPSCTICNLARRDQFTSLEMEIFIGPAIKALMAKRKERL